MEQTTNTADSKFQKFLFYVEKVGNALPHPAILFLILTGVVILLSAVVSGLGIEALHPVKKEVIRATNLFSIAGLHLLLTDMVKNFTSFAPLGTVLVAMLGFSIAEKSGLLPALLRLLVTSAPRKLLTPAILLAGILSHTAGDIGYVLLIPLAAMAFHSVGMNPLAGLAICFAGVSGGFAANLLLSTADPLLSGISQEAARIIDNQYVVTPVVNWYFMATSSFLIVAIGTLVANKITIPFAGEYKGDAPRESLKPLSAQEKRGLQYAGLTALALGLLIALGIIPEAGFLRDPSTDVFHSPLLKGIVTVIFLFGALTGLAYSYGAKTFREPNAVTNAMQDAMVTMAPYLVLVFFASQFIALFNFSNIGLIMAVKGSEALRETGLGIIPLMIGFIILTCLLDLVIGSASAKWALMAPIFVPMFMLLGAAPELTQAAYRIADSVVNIISPLMSYFPLILAFAIKYDPKARVGTVMALMLPYSLAFLLFWSVMLFVWIMLGWPLGPGANLFYQVPGAQ
ncbi:MAG: AbgT family transporter [Bdellovibrionales bacterium]